MGTESASLETKVRLQQCAVCEFMEKGFLKASLRSICREAGVTTGALYFFFQDKDDLFVSLVGDVLQQIQGMMQEHFDKERVEADGDTAVDLETGDYSEDEAVSKMIIHALYEQRDSALLLLTRSQGSSLEGAVDRIDSGSYDSLSYAGGCDDGEVRHGTVGGIFRTLDIPYADRYIYLYDHAY